MDIEQKLKEQIKVKDKKEVDMTVVLAEFTAAGRRLMGDDHDELRAILDEFSSRLSGIYQFYIAYYPAPGGGT